MRRIVLLLLFLQALPSVVTARVLGPCGTDEAERPGAAMRVSSGDASKSLPVVSRVPLPGEKAPNFELPALLSGDRVKNIKLSDYDGKVEDSLFLSC